MLLALLPLFINWILFKVLNLASEFYDLIKEGELFIYSSTLSASSIGQEFMADHHEGLAHETSMLVLIVVLILAACLFAVSGVYRLRKEDLPNRRAIKVGSIACAVAASVFSLVLAFL